MREEDEVALSTTPRRSTTAHPNRRHTVFFRSRIIALILIVVGAVLLMSNIGWIPQLRPLLQHWWPAILIVIGLLMLIRRR